MYYAILDFASDGISNTFRYIMWQMIKPLINVLNVLLNALLNGILPFSILSNEWVNAGYGRYLCIQWFRLYFRISGSFSCTAGHWAASRDRTRISASDAE